MADEICGEWGAALFYRPLSLVLTWPLARFGVPPIAVTILGLLLLPVIALFAVEAAPAAAVPVVCILGALFCVLDCTDGALARALRRESKFGHYVDLSSDLMYRPVIYAALGHLADRLSDSSQSVSLTVALAAAWLALFARMLRLYYKSLLPQPTTAAQHIAVKATPLIGKAYLALSGIDTLLPFLALVLWWVGALPWLFIWLLIYSAADAAYAHVMTLWALRRV